MNYYEKDTEFEFEKEERDKRYKRSIYLSILIGLAAIVFWIFLFARSERFVNIPIGAAMLVIALMALDNMKYCKPVKKLGVNAVKWTGLYITVGDALLQTIIILAGDGTAANIVEHIIYGILFLALGGYSFRYSSISKALATKYCPLEVDGKVVSYNVNHDDENRTDMYAPIFEYTVNGEILRYSEKNHKPYREFKLFDTVGLYIDPDNTEDVWRENKSIERLTKIIGVISIVLGIVIII